MQVRQASVRMNMTRSRLPTQWFAGILEKMNIASENWETMARDRSNWRPTIKAGAKVAHDNWAHRENERCDRGHAVADSNSPRSVTCEDCSKFCASAFGLRSHKRWKHQNSTTK